MATNTVDLSDFKAFDADLRRLVTADQTRALRAGATQVGVQFDEIARGEYPPEVRKRAAAPYWTRKQTRWWWATMRAKALGKSKALPGWKAAYRKVNGRKTLVLSGGYKRTGTLVRSLSYDVQTITGGVQMVYGTNRQYAKWVLDLADQATYHKGNWTPLQSLAAQHAGALQRVFEQAVINEIRRILTEG
mgnify:CR=1 FL=1